MRRFDLPRSVLAALEVYGAALTDRVAAESGRATPNVGDVVEFAWRNRRRSKAMQAAEVALRAMASGLERCMYCEDSQGCDVEHFRPKVSHPASAFVWVNLLWVCATCNRQKNSAFDPRMLDPTRDDPFDHVALTPSTGRLVARSDSEWGRFTLTAMPRLAADPALVRGRLNAFVKLQALLVHYDELVTNRDDARATELRRAVVEAPFSAVFAAVLGASKEPGAAEVLRPDVLRVLSRHPDAYRWLDDADAARARAAWPKIDALSRAVRVRRRPS